MAKAQIYPQTRGFRYGRISRVSIVWCKEMSRLIYIISLGEHDRKFATMKKSLADEISRKTGGCVWGIELLEDSI